MTLSNGHSALHKFVSTNISKEVSDLLTISISATTDFARLTSGCRNILRKALTSGYISCISGSSWAAYCLLADKFQFPVLSLSRADRAAIDVCGTYENAREFAGHMEAMWDLALPALPPERVPYSYQRRFHVYIEEAHMPGYWRVYFRRPKPLTIPAILAALKADSISNYSMKEARMKALQLLDNDGSFTSRVSIEPSA